MFMTILRICIIDLLDDRASRGMIATTSTRRSLAASVSLPNPPTLMVASFVPHARTDKRRGKSIDRDTQ